jgi:hypothetical protein
MARLHTSLKSPRFPKGPGSIPVFQVSALSRDQYRILLDVNQVIYDGGNNNSQRTILQQQQQVDEQKIDVEYQKLRERINDIWFSILFIDEQMKLVDLAQQDIGAAVKKLRPRSRMERHIDLPCRCYRLRNYVMINEPLIFGIIEKRF